MPQLTVRGNLGKPPGGTGNKPGLSSQRRSPGKRAANPGLVQPVRDADPQGASATPGTAVAVVSRATVAKELKLGTLTVFSEGRFRLNTESEQLLSEYLKEAQFDPKVKGYPVHDRTVDIAVELGRGKARTHVIGSDLSHEYVRENADYRT